MVSYPPCGYDTIFWRVLQGKKKKQPPYWMTAFKGVGIALFSQEAALQVSSAPLSLTAVFGMGTGGPSTSSTPTAFPECKSYYTTFFSKCKSFFRFFQTFFDQGFGSDLWKRINRVHPEQRLSLLARGVVLYLAWNA